MTSKTGASSSGNTLIVRYEIDSNDVIVSVGGDWDRFARANGAEELMHDAVIGHPLRRYVVGDVTRMFIDTMLTKIRISGLPLSIPYRCDSPGTKRYMEMQLAMSEVSGHIVASHRLVREEAMPSLSIRALAPQAMGGIASGSLVKRCSMCNRLSEKNGPPLEPDRFPRAKLREPLQVIYHVCHDCQSKLKQRLARTTKSHPKVA